MNGTQIRRERERKKNVLIIYLIISREMKKAAETDRQTLETTGFELNINLIFFKYFPKVTRCFLL